MFLKEIGSCSSVNLSETALDRFSVVGPGSCRENAKQKGVVPVD